MSFYRVGQARRKKPSLRKRPGWDDTVNDLTVFRATPEEMYLRKEAHKSKNHISVKLEKLRKERQKGKMSGAQAQQLAIMKEVLYDQHELQKVLAKSDTMMAVVKDLFGDDPKRFMGFPNVTTAPQADSDPNKSGSLVASVPDIYTRTEKLSDSVMNQSALNDVASDSESGRRPQEESNKTETFSGYTIALVSAVSRLTKYLKETDLRVRTEVTLREQLTQDVYQLRTIIDALATDIILTQEEYGKLYSEHQRYKDNTTAALASVNNQLRELRLMVTGKSADNNTEHLQRPPQENSRECQQPEQDQQHHHQQQHFNTSHSSRKSDESTVSTSIQNQQDSSTPSGSSSYRPLPAQVRPANSIAAATSVVAASAAVMLSPPVRKTRVHTNNAHLSAASHAKSTQRQTSLVDIPDLSRQDPASSKDPPHLTQTPPVMNTINVPRPIPLVQTNISVPLPGDHSKAQPDTKPTSEAPSHTLSQKVSSLTSEDARPGFEQGSKLKSHMDGQVTPREQMLSANGIGSHLVPGPDLSDLVKLGDETEEQLHRLQELAVEEALSNPALQELMQTQIAELNRQQEEARQRLLDLLDKQKMQQTRIQQNFQDPQAGDASSPLSQMQGFKAGRSQVSPPISPISQKPEQEPQSQGRGIVVSLPMVDLDVSGGSLSSPRGFSQPVK
ncbi:spindle and centriole-associated protein 1-like [Plakobranchus ocellatus]|uniref:Spindle and centriole-associated protein 1 n=1 Tax=Plakobranchus ocellatus TaxID=259542 RepID=A0AAV3YBK6_9GAST|nr:spindle and centriole-associated protein 1-like [Plakobranchus ocellatus]